jgi:hypothetical protein
MLTNHLELSERIAKRLADELDTLSLSFEGAGEGWDIFPTHCLSRDTQKGWEAYLHISPPDYDISWDTYYNGWTDKETGEPVGEQPIHTLEVQVSNPHGSTDFLIECYLMREDDERIHLEDFTYLGEKLDSDDWSYTAAIAQSIIDVLEEAYTKRYNPYNDWRMW